MPVDQEDLSFMAQRINSTKGTKAMATMMPALLPHPTPTTTAASKGRRAFHPCAGSSGRNRSATATSAMLKGTLARTKETARATTADRTERA